MQGAGRARRHQKVGLCPSPNLRKMTVCHPVPCGMLLGPTHPIQKPAAQFGFEKRMFPINGEGREISFKPYQKAPWASVLKCRKYDFWVQNARKKNLNSVLGVEFAGLRWFPALSSACGGPPVEDEKLRCGRIGLSYCSVAKVSCSAAIVVTLTFSLPSLLL